MKPEQREKLKTLPKLQALLAHRDHEGVIPIELYLTPGGELSTPQIKDSMRSYHEKNPPILPFRRIMPERR